MRRPSQPIAAGVAPPSGSLSSESRSAGLLHWSVLSVLLAALLVGAATFERRTWGAYVGDEATYLMAAQSLALDGDLSYSARDYERFIQTWGSPPEGLILQRGRPGEGLTYAKEAIYPLVLAPLSRWVPTRAAPLANALALALASLLAARALRRSLGQAAPLWVAVLVFASVTFDHVFWAHADLLLLCLVVIAYSLLRTVGDGPNPTRGRFATGCAVAGVLLGAVAAARPLYLPLLAAATVMVPGARNRLGALRNGGVVLAGAVLPLALGAWLNLTARGTLTSYGGERRAFYSYTGFPEVSLASDAWETHAVEHGSGSWLETPAPQLQFVTAQQLGWNAWYFLLGRAVGVVPYFLPLIPIGAAWRRGEGRLAIVLAAVGIALAFLLIRPFNFWGGGGSLANRYFLPVYGALWFVAARPLRARMAWLTAVCAAPLLWPLWLAPRAFPIAPDGSLRHVAPFARRVLPHETTQSHLKPGGRDDVIQGELWLKFLSPGVRAEDGNEALLLESSRGEILVGSARPLRALAVEVLYPRRVVLRVAGSAVGDVASADGLTRLAPLRVRARHPMWWTTEPFYLYQLRLEQSPRMPARMRFRLQPAD